MSTPRDDKRKPFAFHGVEFTGENATQWLGICPFCDSGRSKFYVNKQNGLWDCKLCDRSGNIGQFLDHIQCQYREALTHAAKRRFAKRLGVKGAALDLWEPGLSFEGRLTFLVRDRDGRATDVRCKPLNGNALSTAGCATGLLGAEQLAHAPSDEPVFLVEGESDAIKVRSYRAERTWKGTVVAVPGATTFKAEWAAWFAGRHVHVLLDNDDTGRRGEQRIYTHLKPVASELTFVHWPSDTPNKYDVRDWLNDGHTWKALRRCFKSEPRLGVPQSKQFAADDAAVAELHAQYVYIVDTDEFLNLRTRRRLKPSMFDRVYAKQFPLGKKSGSNSASQSFWNADGPRVDTTTYRPTAPQSQHDFEASDPLTYESDPGTGARLSAVNIYCPSHVQFSAWELGPGDPAQAPEDARPWLNLGEQLFGSDLPPLLDYMAFTLQNPEQKANWHPWIISEEGAGKDTFFKPFIAAIGDHNVRSVQGKVLRSTFSEWAPENKLVIARDIAKLTEDDWNTLKSFLTHPPDRVLVNRKRIREYWIPNLMHFLFMTNNDDAIELDEQARRLLVLKARAPKRNPEDIDEPYNSDTTNAYIARDRVHRAVCRYLLDRAIDPALMRGRAPDTAAKQAVVEANESELEHHLRRMRDAAEGPFSRELITADELKAQLRIKLHPEPTWKAIGQALKRARLAVRLAKQARYPKAASHKKVWVWATRYAEFYERLTDVQLGEEYERQKRKPSFHSTPESRKALLARKPKLRLVQKRRAQ